MRFVKLTHAALGSSDDGLDVFILAEDIRGMSPFEQTRREAMTKDDLPPVYEVVERRAATMVLVAAKGYPSTFEWPCFVVQESPRQIAELVEAAFHPLRTLDVPRPIPQPEP